MTGTSLLSWGSYRLGSTTSVEDYIGEFLGEFVTDYDTEALANAFRGSVNKALDDENIRLVGNDFVSTVYPAAEDSADLIYQAVNEIELATLAARFEKA
jgi:hypothetical protein